MFFKNTGVESNNTMAVIHKNHNWFWWLCCHCGSNYWYNSWKWWQALYQKVMDPVKYKRRSRHRSRHRNRHRNRNRRRSRGSQVHFSFNLIKNFIQMILFHTSLRVMNTQFTINPLSMKSCNSNWLPSYPYANSFERVNALTQYVWCLPHTLMAWSHIWFPHWAWRSTRETEGEHEIWRSNYNTRL